MFQILEAFDKYKSSMEKIGKALGDYSDDTLLDKLYFFELSVFSFLTGNNDMHLKNFSMIDKGTKWTLAPAYDLLNVNIANPTDNEELALPIEGKKKRLRKEHFERFGKGLGLNTKQIEGVFKRFTKNKALAFEWIDISFLSIAFKQRYREILEKRYLALA
jgi:serine/threonine-protein kinase HipA